MCLFVKDLPVVEGLFEDQVTLRGVTIRSENEFHCEMATHHFRGEVRMLFCFFKGTDLKINAVKSFLRLLSSTNHVAKLIFVIINQTSVFIGAVSCGEGRLHHIQP